MQTFFPRIERVQPLQTSVSKIHAPFKLFMSAHTVKVFWLTGWYLVAFPNCRLLKNLKKKKKKNLIRCLGTTIKSSYTPYKSFFRSRELLGRNIIFPKDIILLWYFDKGGKQMIHQNIYSWTLWMGTPSSKRPLPLGKKCFITGKSLSVTKPLQWFSECFLIGG